MTTNNVGSNLQAAQDAQDAIRQNKTAAASQKKDAVKAALTGNKTSQASQKKEAVSNSANPAAKVDISADAKKQAAGAEGKTTEKAKPVNSYDQLMSKVKARRETKGNEAKTTEKAAATEGKTTEKADAAEGKKEEKAKQVNPYANAHSAQDIRKVTSQLMSKAKASGGSRQSSLRAVV